MRASEYACTATLVRMASPNVELLYFDSCPNYKAARAMIQRVAAEERAMPDLHAFVTAEARPLTRFRCGTMTRPG
jgi:hypothetical protein